MNTAETIRLVNDAGFDDALIFIASHLIQPFVAWNIPREASHRELALSRHYRFEVRNYLVRYIFPVLLLVIILAACGII
ncbi:MAG: hypothetical protein GY815_03845 [Gammaproteobacteria bacterium]|nr:hypothetical protein [Gammaproteobacteria bacterium]